MKRNALRKMVLSSAFLALGMVLPLFTAQIKEIGDTLLPMHIPVMLCGALCGPVYGASVGFILPFLRSLIFSMPPMYPNAVWMALELMTYAAVIGILYSRHEKTGVLYTYICLVASMLSGRIVWGIAKAFLLGMGGKGFTFAAFIAGGFVDSLLGIIVQLVLIPAILTVISRQKRP